MSLKEIKTEDVTYYELNNQINIPVNGQIPLQKDQEALDAFLEQNVQPNMVTFKSLQDRLDYLVAENYYEADFFEGLFSFIHGRIESIFKGPRLPLQVIYGCL